MFILSSQKAIAPVIAVSLLLVVAVTSVVTFNTWYDTYQSTTLADVETQSSQASSNSQIETIVGDTLYFKNQGTQVINYSKIKIGGIDCNLSGNLTIGISTLNVSTCIANLTTSTPQVVIYTNSKIYQKTLYLKNQVISLSSNVSSGPFIPLYGNLSSFYVASNGVTVKCENASVGSSYTFTAGPYTGKKFIAIDDTNISTQTPTNTASFYEQACTSHVTSLVHGAYYGVLYSATINPNISSWDVSNVTNMSYAFYNTNIFNADLSSWDTSKVTDLSFAFSHTSAYNQPLNSWDVSHVTTMYQMFSYASVFNQSLNLWDTSSVVNMPQMFYYATTFNGNISNWNTSSVLNMGYMFYLSSKFNQNISNWDTSKVTTMEQMFNSASKFNQNLASWSVSNVTLCSNFNAGASSWVLPQPNFTACTP